MLASFCFKEFMLRVMTKKARLGQLDLVVVKTSVLRRKSVKSRLYYSSYCATMMKSTSWQQSSIRLKIQKWEEWHIVIQSLTIAPPHFEMFVICYLKLSVHYLMVTKGDLSEF